MTKQIRIENADTGSFPVRVTIEHKHPETGQWSAHSHTQIDRPTQMTEQYITSHRRLVIEEIAADPPAAA